MSPVNSPEEPLDAPDFSAKSLSASTDGSAGIEWSTRLDVAEQMVSLIGQLHRRYGVVTSIHGHHLNGLSAADILHVHDRAHHDGHEPVYATQTAEALHALLQLAPPPASVDVARVDRTRPLPDALRDALNAATTAAQGHAETDVVLYGFGRIGRLVARILLGQGALGNGVRLRAIVVRRGSADDLQKRASLLARDSVHGPFAGTVATDMDANALVVNGHRVQVIYADDPSNVDYTAFGIRDAIVVDNTGRWRDADGLGQHLRSPGVARVLLTAPGKTPVKNIVHGINEHTITAADVILSAASCTTNAITPVLKAVEDAYGIVRGHVETVHSFTNDQNLTDNFHTGSRRGRSAVLNMVITETGAAKAVSKALPELAGKLTGSSIRVPTPDVSLAILTLTLAAPAAKNDINDYFRRLSLHSALRQQIDYVESPEIVSTDFVGSPRTGIVDGLATIANDHALNLYVWYDNEHGYSAQVVRILETLAGSHLTVVPPRREVTLAKTAAITRDPEGHK